MRKEDKMVKKKSIKIYVMKIIAIIILCLVILLFSDWNLSMTLSLSLIFVLAVEFMAVCISGSKVIVRVKMPQSMIKDETKLICVRIVNNSIFPLAGVKIRLKLANVYTGEVIYYELKKGLIPKLERTKELHLKSNRVGVVKAECLGISTYGFLKVVERRVIFSKEMPSEQGETMIYPNVEKVPNTLAALESHDIESFKYAENKLGNDSSEIIGIRNMRPQDSLKLIHWKLSAKFSEPVVKELSYPVDTKVMIIFDAMGFDNPTLADKAVETLMGVSLQMSRMHIHHGISWYDEKLNIVETKSIEREEELYLALLKIMKQSNRRNYEETAPFMKMEGYSRYVVITRNQGLIERIRQYGAVTELKIDEFQ